MNEVITPTRHLKARERAVFNRVVDDFGHLRQSDAELLTMLSEATVRYETALKETRKHPAVAVPVINRATGNQTGEKIVRNPAFITLREAQSAVVSLSRRLLIDAHSVEKRKRLATKTARSFLAQEGPEADTEITFTEAQIQHKMAWLRRTTGLRGELSLRQNALIFLVRPVTDADDAEFLAQLIYTDDDGTKHPSPSVEELIKTIKQ